MEVTSALGLEKPPNNEHVILVRWPEQKKRKERNTVEMQVATISFLAAPAKVQQKEKFENEPIGHLQV